VRERCGTQLFIQDHSPHQNLHRKEERKKGPGGLQREKLMLSIYGTGPLTGKKRSDGKIVGQGRWWEKKKKGIRVWKTHPKGLSKSEERQTHGLLLPGSFKEQYFK